MARTFFPTEKYGTKPATFSLLPFRFMRLNSKELLVNEAGEFLFAPSGTVQDLAEGSVPINSELYLDLKAEEAFPLPTTRPLLRCSIFSQPRFAQSSTTSTAARSCTYLW